MKNNDYEDLEVCEECQIECHSECENHELLANQLSEWEQSQLFAWCCGQLTGYRQRLQRPIRIKVLKETCHCDEEREAILNYITNKNKEIKDKNSDV